MMTLSCAVEEIKMCKRECEIKIHDNTATQREIDFVDAVDTVCYWMDKMYSGYVKFNKLMGVINVGK